MLKCKYVSDLLSCYFDGALDDDLSEQVSQHIDVCQSCREEFEAIKAVSNAIKDSEVLPVTDEFKRKLHMSLAEVSMGKIEDRQSAWFLRPVWLTSFSTVAVCFLLIFVFSGDVSAPGGIAPETVNFSVSEALGNNEVMNSGSIFFDSIGGRKDISRNFVEENDSGTETIDEAQIMPMQEEMSSDEKKGTMIFEATPEFAAPNNAPAADNELAISPEYQDSVGFFLENQDAANRVKASLDMYDFDVRFYIASGELIIETGAASSMELAVEESRTKKVLENAGLIDNVKLLLGTGEITRIYKSTLELPDEPKVQFGVNGSNGQERSIIYYEGSGSVHGTRIAGNWYYFE